MENFGTYLKLQREKKGIRLEEIASITKIHLHSLELLEGGQWDHLPPEPFIRGFIIAYAKYVGLDSKETVGKYLDEVGQKEAAVVPDPASTEAADHRSGESPSEVIEKSDSPYSRKILIFAAASVLVVICVGLTMIGKSAADQSPTEATAASATASPGLPAAGVPAAVAPMQAQAQTATPELPTSAKAKVAAADPREVASPKASPESAKPVEPVAKPAPAKAKKAAATEDKAAHEVLIEAQDRTWMKVVIDDEPPKQFVMNKGDSHTYSADTKIKVVLGNAAGSRVVHNGEEVEGKLYHGTIRYYVFPRGSRFPQDPPPPKKPVDEESVSETSKTSHTTTSVGQD